MTADVSSLIGRRAETAFVADLLADASAAGLVLAGPPGVGKSALLAASLGIAREAGAAAVAVRAAPTSPPAPLEALGPVLDGARTWAAARRELARRAAAGLRLVLGVDDAHRLDEASAALLHDEALAGRALVLLAVGAPAGGPAAAALVGEARFERLDLAGLAPDETGELAEALLGAPVEVRTRARLWRDSGGNPLHLRELIAHGQAAGSLARHADGWRIDPDRWAPAALDELVRARLDHAPRGALNALALVAADEPLEAAAARAVLGGDALAEAEAAELVRRDDDGQRRRLRPAHAVYGESLGRRPVGEGAALRGRLADALERTGLRRRGDVLRAASLRLASGAGAPPGLLLDAAREAVERFDACAAERFARAAAAASAAAGDRAREQDAFVALADALQRQGRFEETAAALAQAAPGVQRALLQSANLFFGMADEDGARRALADARAGACDRDERVRLAVADARLSLCAGRPRDARLAAERLLAIPQLGGAVRAEAQLVLAPALAALGRNGEAIRLLLPRLGPPAARWDDAPSAAGAAHVAACLAFVHLGELDEAERAADELRVAGRQANAPAAIAEADTIAGVVACERGRLTEGRRLLRGATRALGPDWAGLAAWGAGARVEAAAVAGDAAEAQLAELEASAAGRRAVRWLLPRLTLGVAAAFAVFGQPERAETLLADMSGQAAAAGQRMIELSAAHAVLRWCPTPPAAADALAAVRGVDGTRAACIAAHADAVAAGDAAALFAAARGYERAGFGLWAAQTSLAALAAAGPAAPPAWSATADALLGACSGVDPRALAGGLPRAAILTARQRGVAERAGRAGQAGAAHERAQADLAEVCDRLGAAGLGELRAALDGDGRGRPSLE